MQWDSTIRVADIAIAAATLLGPIFAIQIQMWLDRLRSKRARRQQIFYTLMRTRASSLAPDHLHALNAVPIEFYGVKKVSDSYQAFISHTYVLANQPTPEDWIARRQDLLMDLIFKISTNLGYDFDVAQLKRDFYAPQYQQTVDNEQNAIRQGLAKILAGQSALPMDVKSLPGDPEAQAALKSVLKGESHLKVKIEEDPKPEPLRVGLPNRGR